MTGCHKSAGSRERATGLNDANQLMEELKKKQTKKRSIGHDSDIMVTLSRFRLCREGDHFMHTRAEK